MPSSIESSRNPTSPSIESRSEANPERAPAAAKRQPWVRPRLECFGDVRQVTMGGTVGINESGTPTRFP